MPETRAIAVMLAGLDSTGTEIPGRMLRRMKLASVAVVAGALVLGVITPAVASIPTRVTAGEANAVFQTQWTGGIAMGNNPAGPVGAPRANEVVPVVMSPISSSPDDPFCILDWHVIRVLVGLPTREDLANTAVHIWLDGAPLQLVTTAIKPFPHLPVYGRAYGLVVPPGTPAAGPHTLTATITWFDGTSSALQTIVNVYPADSPACTGS